MSVEPQSLGSTVGQGRRVVTALDDTDGEERVVIADISADDVWLSMPTTASAALVDWR
ncbi:DUF7556 family protein [Haloarcula marina]|uniref:DUF7556 family protein n=1 Tax=Haloarcula marina TaxID=2961574 RepID=UPI0020B766E1|nr:hypothetical protein [Halomicroarcula marina]